jgi:hypothetical protein
VRIINLFKGLFSFLAFAGLVIVVLFNVVPAQATNSLNVQGQSLNFTNASLVGALALPGSTFNYSNVLTGVDAKVTYVSTDIPTAKVDMNWIDQVSTDVTLKPSIDLKFENIKVTGTQPSNLLVGYNVKLRIDFFVSGTSTPIELKGFSALARDIDVKQGVAFAGATTVLTSTGTPLSVTRNTNGIQLNELNGTASALTDKNYWGEWKFDSAVSSVGVTLFSGNTGGNAFWLEFQTAAWGATTTTATYAPPVAASDSYTTPFNTALSGVAATGDSYPAGTIFAQTSQPANGSVVWNNDGTYTYTPNTGFTGVDSFTYEITAPDGQRSSATQNITVQAAVATPTPAPTSTPTPTSTSTPTPSALAAAPNAVNDNYSTAFNTPVNGVAGTGDSFASGSTFTQTSQPANGSVVWNSDGTYTYTPNTGFTGVDSFTYEITAPDGQRSSATQNITVQTAVATPAPSSTATPIATPTSDPATVVPPIAVDDNYTTEFNTMVSGVAGTGDTYAPGSTFAQTSQPANGSVVWNSDGTYTYRPTDGFSGVDSFTYAIIGPDGQTASATQTITIEAEPNTEELELAYTGANLETWMALALFLFAAGSSVLVLNRIKQNRVRWLRSR